ncbi:MAG: alkaline phosphatase [bacterium]
MWVFPRGRRGDGHLHRGKTYNGAIGVDPKMHPLRHITQFAEDLGKATGVVTTVQWSHATPAGFVAHNLSRHNYVEIAQEIILDSACEVIMGCGHSWDEMRVIVTGAHEYGYLTGPGSGLLTDDPWGEPFAVWNPVANNSPGKLAGMAQQWPYKSVNTSLRQRPW